MTTEERVLLRRLEFEHFRRYSSFAIDIPAAGLRIAGPNGSGKTTIVEAIELLSTTRPRHGAQDGDLIAFDSGIDLGVAPYARVRADVERDGVLVQLEVFIERSLQRNTVRKLLRVSDRPRRAGDVIGLVPTVGFAPDDLDLVLGAPALRRRFLDVFLGQIDRRYLRNLSRYNRILSQRNGLLRRSSESGQIAVDEFAFWDEQLVALGAYVIAARARAVHALAATAWSDFARLSQNAPELGLNYASSLEATPAWWQSSVLDPPTVIDAAQRVAGAFQTALERYRRKDVERGSTQVGPHRDDLEFMFGTMPLDRFGSRGQQRLAVLALKMAELREAFATLDVVPILLLDDVLSELDAAHRVSLLDLVATMNGQVIITSTDRALLDMEELRQFELLELG